MSKPLKKAKISRRDFLGDMSIIGSLAAVGAVTAYSLCLVKPKLLPEASSKFSIGLAESYPAGTSKVIPGRNLLVVSTEEGIGGISLICTHLGCVVLPDEIGFKCPCHGSKFDDSGKVLAGPAPSPLPWFSISQRADGKLVVNAKSSVEPGTFFKA